MTGRLYALDPHARTMTSEAAIEKKMSEVSDIAARLGVDRYLGTERMSTVEAIVAEWAVVAQGADLMGQESLWLDAKSEIENVLSNMSLTHNSKHDLYLLGASQSGAMPLDEVKSSLIDGWNKLLKIHAVALEGMSDHDLRTIDRARDSALSKIPVYGSIEDKQYAIASARESLLALEQTLVASSKGAEKAKMKGEIANRMTTKGMVLAEAKSAKKQALIPYGDYQEIQTLLGNGGVFDEQVKSIGDFAHSPEIILEQMDRVLERALSILNRESGATTLAGGMFVGSNRQQRISLLGSTSNGDGFRVSGMENANYRGEVSPYGAVSNSFKTSTPFDARNPGSHKVSTETHGPIKHKAAGKLAAMHAKKNEALYSAPMGGVPNNILASGTIIGLGLIWGATKILGGKSNGKRRKTRPPVTDWSNFNY